MTINWALLATSNVYGDEQISFHFLELGNNNTGDSVYIKAGEVDILIDAGSRQNSAPTLVSYINQYCSDGILEYVIATHAHQDHIAGFTDTSKTQGIFSSFECETIIDFPRTNANTSIYNKYVTARDAEVAAGATHYTALQCVNQTDGAQKTYVLAPSITMTFLYQIFYENNTSDENDYSVCVLFTHGDKNYLFTGDLESAGEASLVENNDLPEVELFKAGHHGSYTASSDTLLSVVKPKMVCVCCCAGAVEYMTSSVQNLSHTFPSQEFIDRVAPYTSKVYVTTRGEIEYDEEKGKYVDVGFVSMNGNITVTSFLGNVTVACSNNNTLLKDTDWFQNNRTTPDAWTGGGITRVSIPTADDTVFTYNGSPQTYTIAANDAYTVTDNVKTEAGSYTVTVSLNNKTTSTWNDFSVEDKTYVFVINKASVNKPVADDTVYTYTGSAQTYQIEANAAYSVNNATQTAVGIYTVTVSLNDEDNYEWAESGNANDLEYEFIINGKTVIPRAVSYGNAEMSFHFIYTGSTFGDCVYVKAGDKDILIDAGKSTTVAEVKAYVDQYCLDGTLEYVIATHPHQEAISGFAGDNGIFAKYDCEMIIDFPSTKQTSAFYATDYLNARAAEITAGATHYTALQCVDETDGAKSTYYLGEGMYMSILYQKYYESENSTTNYNNDSVCVLFTHGDRYFLFTGDLETAGENSLIANNALPEVVLVKAGNQGSSNCLSANLLSAINPSIICINANAQASGSPNQTFIDRIAAYNPAVYVTGQNSSGVSALNGNIVVSSLSSGVSVDGSASDLEFKDSDWFAANRTWTSAE